MLFFCFSMMGLGFAKELIPAIIALLFTGIFSSFANTTMVTALQSIIDMDKMGRVMSLFTMASTGLVPISQGFIPMILNKGVSLSYLLIAGSSITCVFLISVLLLVKTIRSQ
jgi:MFS transporter, DHA3 family, macrolide efflux protein